MEDGTFQLPEWLLLFAHSIFGSPPHTLIDLYLGSLFQLNDFNKASFSQIYRNLKIVNLLCSQDANDTV